MVKDKINYRAKGPRTLMTRQTVQGRANDGGLRIGEMERDGIIGHGATSFLNESMMIRGDKYYAAVCNKTGCLAIYNKSKNIFLSPMADGPIKFTGNIDDNLNIENVSKHGRDFSIICVPYCFKLLMQELGAMNVQMRIITEDNIEQIQNMSYSNTINNLLMEDNVNYTKVALDNRSKITKSEINETQLNEEEIKEVELEELVPEEETDETTAPLTTTQQLASVATGAASTAVNRAREEVMPVVEDVTKTISDATPSVIKEGLNTLAQLTTVTPKPSVPIQQVNEGEDEEGEENVEIAEKAITLDNEVAENPIADTATNLQPPAPSGVTINLYNTPQPVEEISKPSINEKSKQEKNTTIDTEMAEIIDQNQPLKISKIGEEEEKNEEKNEENKEENKDSGVKKVTFN